MEDLQKFVDEELERRKTAAAKLAERYKELAGLDYVTFLLRLDEEGLELDFVTSAELWQRLNAAR